MNSCHCVCVCVCVNFISKKFLKIFFSMFKCSRGQQNNSALTRSSLLDLLPRPQLCSQSSLNSGVVMNPSALAPSCRESETCRIKELSQSPEQDLGGRGCDLGSNSIPHLREVAWLKCLGETQRLDLLQPLKYILNRDGWTRTGVGAFNWEIPC